MYAIIYAIHLSCGAALRISSRTVPQRNHLMALAPHCNRKFYSRGPTACLARDPEFLQYLRDPHKRAHEFNFEHRN